MDFFEYDGGRESITLDELKKIWQNADGPADLINIVDSMGINLGFAEIISAIWRKQFNADRDAALLNKIAHQSDHLIGKFK